MSTICVGQYKKLFSEILPRSCDKKLGLISTKPTANTELTVLIFISVFMVFVSFYCIYNLGHPKTDFFYNLYSST